MKLKVSKLLEIKTGYNGIYWGFKGFTLNTFSSIFPSHASWQIRVSTSFC